MNSPVQTPSHWQCRPASGYHGYRFIQAVSAQCSAGAVVCTGANRWLPAGGSGLPRAGAIRSIPGFRWWAVAVV